MAFYKNIYSDETLEVDDWEDGYIVLDKCNDEQVYVINEKQAIAAARAILKHFNATLESDQ